MDPMQDHTIAFTGLKDGRHVFHFDLDDRFFAAAQQEEFEGGKLAVEVTLDKTPQMLVAVIHVDGTVTVHCDHCNGLMEQPVKGEQRQIFQLEAGDAEDEDEELVFLDPQAHEINLTHYFFECIALHLPARRVHPQGQCDPEVDSALGTRSQEHEPVPDPRWAVLNDLKKKAP